MVITYKSFLKSYFGLISICLAKIIAALTEIDDSRAIDGIFKV